MKFNLLVILLLLSLSISAQEPNCACCSENHKQFDFWIGSWEAFDPDGKLAGTNSIEKIQNNCILKEIWESAVGD